MKKWELRIKGLGGLLGKHSEALIWCVFFVNGFFFTQRRRGRKEKKKKKKKKKKKEAERYSGNVLWKQREREREREREMLC